MCICIFVQLTDFPSSNKQHRSMYFGWIVLSPCLYPNLKQFASSDFLPAEGGEEGLELPTTQKLLPFLL